MTKLDYAAELRREIDRIVAHLEQYEAQHIDERLAEVFDALLLLERHPLIGRPSAEGHRELVIGEGNRGYVALYRYDALDDAVEVLALRGQRESGFRDR